MLASLLCLEAVISKEKLTNMQVDDETKTAFVTDKKGKLMVFDFKEVKILL